MKLLDEHIGKALSAEEVADYIGCDVKTVRKHYEDLGGMRLGRHYLFFERSIIDAVSKGQKWIAQVRKEGKRLEKVFWTKKEALSWEAKMRRKPAIDWNVKTATACLGDWAQAYLDFAEARFTVKTYKEKRALFRLFFREVSPALPVANLKTRPCDELHRQAKQGSVWVFSQQGPKEPCGGLELGYEVPEAPTTPRAQPMRR